MEVATFNYKLKISTTTSTYLNFTTFASKDVFIAINMISVSLVLKVILEISSMTPVSRVDKDAKNVPLYLI